MAEDAACCAVGDLVGIAGCTPKEEKKTSGWWRAQEDDERDHDRLDLGHEPRTPQDTRDDASRKLIYVFRGFTVILVFRSEQKTKGKSKINLKKNFNVNNVLKYFIYRKLIYLRTISLLPA